MSQSNPLTKAIVRSSQKLIAGTDFSNPEFTRLSDGSARIGTQQSPNRRVSIAGREERRNSIYQLLRLLDLPVDILDEGPFLTCKLRHLYWLSLLNADLTPRVARRLSPGTRDVPSVAASATSLTAALDPYPADFRGDVSCQNGVLLLVVVNERRHLGHECTIDHRREPDGDSDTEISRRDKAVSQTRGEQKETIPSPPARCFSFARDRRQLVNSPALLFVSSFLPGAFAQAGELAMETGKKWGQKLRS